MTSSVSTVPALPGNEFHPGTNHDPGAQKPTNQDSSTSNHGGNAEGGVGGGTNLDVLGKEDVRYNRGGD